MNQLSLDECVKLTDRVTEWTYYHDVDQRGFNGSIGDITLSIMMHPPHWYCIEIHYKSFEIGSHHGVSCENQEDYDLLERAYESVEEHHRKYQDEVPKRRLTREGMLKARELLKKAK